MADVFISYARSTEKQAQAAAGSLRSLGYSVWFDEELPTHRAYTDVIEEELEAAKAVLVIWSAEAVRSQWVMSEANRARAADKLVQMAIDGARLPMPFDQIQCAELKGWSGDTEVRDWARIIASITDLVGTRKAAPLTITAPLPAVATAFEPLLAVLPFDNLSGDADLLYFSDGLSEEILQTVVRTTGLKVIGRSSSFQFRGAAKVARQVAGDLGCSHVLDGSVRRSGERVRIAASLVECDSQTTLWSDRFDRDLSDVFALQDEIAEAVALALKATFAPSPITGPIDPVAYDLYLRARTSSPGRMGAFDAGLLQQATARAPGFAQAWAALAITRATQAANAEGPRLTSARPEAFEAAHKALALDPGAGTAYVALALLEPVCGRFKEIEDLFERALEASPDDQVVLERLSRWLHGVGRSREALARITRAYEIDPLYHQGANWYAVMISLEGRTEEAFTVWDKARERWPAFDVLLFNPLGLATNIGDWGRVEQLLAHAEALELNSLHVREAVARARKARHAGPQSADSLIERMKAEVGQSGTVDLRILVDTYAQTQGAADGVFEVVEQASFAPLFEPGGRLVPRDYGLHVLFNGDQPIQRDPRFPRLCAKLGLCDYWSDTEHWPDCADRVDLLYDFKAESRQLSRRG